MALKQPKQEAVELLEKALTRSKRTATVRLPVEFARDRINAPAQPPLALILYGGGEVRIKVLLTVLMQATKPPHATKARAKELAAMLDLRDPEGAGGKRVAKALRDLENVERENGSTLSLVEVDRPAGRVPTVKVLNPDGSGQEWTDRKLGNVYITLPIALWRNGWLIALSGRALALLVILRELTGHRKTVDSAWCSGIRKRQYGLSDDTWTKATRELVDAGLLSIRSEVYSSNGEPRRRNVYTLHLGRLETHRPNGDPLDQSAGKNSAP